MKAKGQDGSAAIILHNGKIITVDRDFTVAQAVAIRDGRFIAVGSNNKIKHYAGHDTEMIDLNGQTVTPGLIDSHTHPVLLGKNLLCPVQLSHVKKLDDIFEAVATAAKKTPRGEWIVSANNWPHHDVEHLPTAAELDSVAPDNPVWIPAGVHRGSANSMALKMAGITKDTESLPGGKVFKDPKTGEPTGRLDETAEKLIQDMLPPVDLCESLREARSYYNSIGVTAIMNDGIDPEEQIAYLKLKSKGELSLRSVVAQWITPSQSREEVVGIIKALAGAGLEEIGDDNLKIVGIKTINEDLVPGNMLWPRDYLRDMLLEAAKYNLRAFIHSTFKANEENLGLYQEVNQSYPITHLRWGLVHQRMTTPEFIEINKQLGLVINQDASFGLITLITREKDRMKIVPGRLYCPIPLYLKTGMQVGLNSDGGGTCTVPSLWTAVWVVTHRELWPEFGREYSVSREEALRLATMGGAYRMMMEDRIGSIETGKLADLAVLSADPLTCPDDQLKDIGAVMTVFGGRIVYHK